jgi:hypothetical protein
MTTPMDDTLTAIGRQLSVAYLPTVLEPLPRELNDLVAHASVAPTRPMDCRFLLRGPMAVGHDAPTTCWREAPALGHTGSTRIVITPYGIMADVVAYDLNLASDLLRRCAARQADALDFAPAA